MQTSDVKSPCLLNGPDDFTHSLVFGSSGWLLEFPIFGMLIDCQDEPFCALVEDGLTHSIIAAQVNVLGIGKPAKCHHKMKSSLVQHVS